MCSRQRCAMGNTKKFGIRAVGQQAGSGIEGHVSAGAQLIPSGFVRQGQRKWRSRKGYRKVLLYCWPWWPRREASMEGSGWLSEEGRRGACSGGSANEGIGRAGQDGQAIGKGIVLWEHSSDRVCTTWACHNGAWHRRLQGLALAGAPQTSVTCLTVCCFLGAVGEQRGRLGELQGAPCPAGTGPR